MHGCLASPTSQWRQCHTSFTSLVQVIRERTPIHGERNAGTIARGAKENSCGWATASLGTRLPFLAVSHRKPKPQNTEGEQATSGCLGLCSCLFVLARSLGSLPWLVVWFLHGGEAEDLYEVGGAHPSRPPAKRAEVSKLLLRDAW